MVSPLQTLVELPENLSVSASTALKAELDLATSQVVKLDASKVTHVDSPCAQILVSFLQYQQSRGATTEFLEVSTQMQNDLKILNLDSLLLTREG